MVTDLHALVRALATTDPTRPRLTWYGPEGERVEFSGKVLDNWVAKTANLLVEEVDAGPGSRIGVDLPTHWRQVVWMLAVWSVGGCVVTDRPEPADDGDGHGDGDGGAAVDAWVTDRPGSAAAQQARAAGALVMAVALPALATRFPDPLPGADLDAGAEVRGRGDVFVPLVAPAVTDDALAAGRRVALPFGALLPAARDSAARHRLAEQVRLLCGPGPGADVVDTALAAFALDGSLVLHHGLAGLTAEQVTALTDQERVTAVRPSQG